MPVRFRSFAVIAALLIATFAIAGEYIARPAIIAPIEQVQLPRQPVAVIEVSIDETMEAVELELASRLVGVAPGEAHEVAKVLVEESRKAGFDPWFVIAIIEVESGYDADACSSAGARGLMQLMPTTFRSVSTHYRVSDPVENVRAGIAYLVKLHKAGFNTPHIILLAYNGGPSGALSYLRATWSKKDTSDFPDEMKQYPAKVLQRYKRLLHAVGNDKPNVVKSWRLP